MDHHAGLWLLGLLLLADVWIGLILRRRHLTRRDWSVAAVGTLAMLAGLSILPRHLLGHGWQGLASAVLGVCGAVAAAASLLRATRLPGASISDMDCVARYKRSTARTGAATVAAVLALIAFLALFPRYSAPATYLIGQAFPLSVAAPLCFYIPLAVVWLCWMKRGTRGLAGAKYGRALCLCGFAAVVCAFVPLALHVRHIALAGYHPAPAIASAYAIVLAMASVDCLIMVSSHYLALWGIAAGA
jgi:hypothetical protein